MVRAKLAALGRFLVGMAVLTYLSDLVIVTVRHRLWGVAALFVGWTFLFAILIWVTDLRPSRKRSPMSLLSKSDIFAADDRKYEDVEVPEWHGTVRLRGLTGAERDRYEASMQKQIGGKQVQDLRNFRARLVQLAAINEDGSPLFDLNEVASLANRSSAALSRLFDAACRLSGITDDDVKDLEGNSEPAQSGPSTSVSHSPSVPALSPNSWPVSAPTN
jgi:hypothetical protein